MKPPITTKENIYFSAKEIFAQQGYDGLSMRELAQISGVGLSVIYYHYKDKDVLLAEICQTTLQTLEQKYTNLTKPPQAQEQFVQLIEFKLSNARAINFLLKYYYYTHTKKPKDHTIPLELAKPMKSVLLFAQKNGAASLPTPLDFAAQTIDASINATILEYFPDIPSGKAKKRLIANLSSFFAVSFSQQKGGSRFKIPFK